MTGASFVDTDDWEIWSLSIHYAFPLICYVSFGQVSLYPKSLLTQALNSDSQLDNVSFKLLVILNILKYNAFVIKIKS